MQGAAGVLLLAALSAAAFFVMLGLLVTREAQHPTVIAASTTSTTHDELEFAAPPPPVWDTCDRAPCSVELQAETPVDPLPPAVHAALERLHRRTAEPLVWSADAVPLDLRVLTDALLLVGAPPTCCGGQPLFVVTLDGVDVLRIVR